MTWRSLRSPCPRSPAWDSSCCGALAALPRSARRPDRALLVSAQYRRVVLREDGEALERDLHQIWEPSGVWKDFIAR